MMPPLTTAELEERSRALREAFPDLPPGGRVLFGALVDAAASDREDPEPEPTAEHGGPE